MKKRKTVVVIYFIIAAPLLLSLVDAFFSHEKKDMTIFIRTIGRDWEMLRQQQKIAKSPSTVDRCYVTKHEVVTRVTITGVFTKQRRSRNHGEV